MSASSDIANFQMSAPFLVRGGALIKLFSCGEGRSFEGDVHLGRGALSDNHGILKNTSGSDCFYKKNLSKDWVFMILDLNTKTCKFFKRVNILRKSCGTVMC